MNRLDSLIMASRKRPLTLAERDELTGLLKSIQKPPCRVAVSHPLTYSELAPNFDYDPFDELNALVSNDYNFHD